MTTLYTPKSNTSSEPLGRSGRRPASELCLGEPHVLSAQQPDGEEHARRREPALGLFVLHRSGKLHVILPPVCQRPSALFDLESFVRCPSTIFK